MKESLLEIGPITRVERAEAEVGRLRREIAAVTAQREALRIEVERLARGDGNTEGGE